MDIDAIIGDSPDAIINGIAERARQRRLEKDLTQKAFARRAGIGYDAYRKFETTGEISLRNLIRCAIILDDTDGLDSLFRAKQYGSLDALIESKQSKKKKRATKNE